MTPLDRVHDVLQRHGIPHALIGAAAMAVHGVARSTLDIDLLVVDRRVLDTALWEALPPAGISVDVRCGDDDDPLAGVVRVETPGERPVDVVVGRHAWQDRVLGRAWAAATDDVPVVAIDDLVALKLYAGGTQDRWDVEQLIGAQSNPAALVAAVEDRLAEMPDGLRVRWAEWAPTLRPGA